MVDWSSLTAGLAMKSSDNADGSLFELIGVTEGRDLILD
jgi:hypothetical protein